MNRLGLIPCLGALLTLPACIVTYGLGETAEDTTDGSGEGTGTGVDTDPDPSATSGQPGTTDPSTSSDTATGQVPETTDGPDTETDGEPSSCDVDPDTVQWQFNGASFSPLEGVDASFVAILGGDCTVGEITESVPEAGDPVWRVPLQCSLQGRIDADGEFAGELSPVLEMTNTIGYEVVSSFGDEVRLELVLDWWGMGWNGWLVLENPDTGEQLLDLVNAEYVDPISSTWSRQLGEELPGPWRSNLSVSVAETECGAVGMCNDEPRALWMGIGPDSQLLLNEGQEGIMSNEALSLLYRASVTAARAIPMATCTDTPLGHYAFAVWMQSQ
jgi:hypothetical protein